MLRRALVLFLLAVVLGAAKTAAAQPKAPPAFDNPLITDLSAHLIAIQEGFNGTSLLLFGSTEEPGDIVVVVRGPSVVTTVRRKSKSFGIWLNTDQVTFEDVPGYYNLISSRPLIDIASPGLFQRMRLGVDNLRLLPRQTVSDTELRLFRQALIRNRMKDKLFQENQSAVNFLGPRLFRVNIDFPSTVPTGTYRVEVYLIREERIVAAQATPLFVNKLGFEHHVSAFARDRALAYGAISVLLALTMGWVAAMVFRRD